jgi:hypothetical protein
MWKVPKIWEGGECWILGGGPSLPYQFEVPENIIQQVCAGELTPDAYSPYLSVLHDKHVIAVNMSYLIGTWIDMVFFGDGGYYLKNRVTLLNYPKLKVSCAPKIKNFPNDGVKFIARDQRKPSGISSRNGYVSWNKNSGAAAINLAVHFGVKRIYLLGFDMDVLDGNQHWHNLYGKNKSRKNGKPHKLPFTRHKKGFSTIKKDADNLGVEIINCSPSSTIQEFKKMSVKEILNEPK